MIAETSLLSGFDQIQTASVESVFSKHSGISNVVKGQILSIFSDYTQNRRLLYSGMSIPDSVKVIAKNMNISGDSFQFVINTSIELIVAYKQKLVCSVTM